MIGKDQPHEDAPNDPRPAAEQKEHRRERELERKHEPVEQLIERVVDEVGCVLPALFIAQAGRIRAIDPLDVRPRDAVEDAMWIAFLSEKR